MGKNFNLVCKVCNSSYQGHGNSGYCSNCLYLPCKRCDKKVRVVGKRRKTFKFCSYFCSGKSRMALVDQSKIKRKYGTDHPNYKGGFIEKRGYKWICVKGQRIYEHRFIMEKYLNRKLTSNEIIHHINKIRSDNRMENLELIDRVNHSSKYPQPKLKSIFYSCKKCGSKFVDLKSKERLYCSKKCMYQWNK